jgi:hypothetical protein
LCKLSERWQVTWGLGHSPNFPLKGGPQARQNNDEWMSVTYPL